MRKNRERKLNGTYFVKSNIISEIANQICSQETQYMFMEILEEAMIKFKITIKNFIILKDEFQIVIQTIGKTDISEVMQWIKQIFSIRFNKRFNRIGTVWRSRFKSILLKVKENVEKFIKIINELPVKLKLCIAKGEYRFSGLYHIKNRINTIIN